MCRKNIYDSHTHTHLSQLFGVFYRALSHQLLCEIIRDKKIKSKSEIGDFLIPPVCDVIDAGQPVFTPVGQLKRESGGDWGGGGAERGAKVAMEGAKHGADTETNR